MSARLQISTTNRENVLTISLNSNNVKNLKKILGLIVTNKDEKFEVLNCFLLSAEIDVTEYFKNPCTLDELQEGVKELYQNVTDLESKDRDILIDFFLSNMYWGYIHDYTNEYVYDYVDLEEIVRDNVWDSEILECILEHSATEGYTIKTILETMENGDTENGTN